MLRIWRSRPRGWNDHDDNRRDSIDLQPALLRDLGPCATPQKAHGHLANAEAQLGMAPMKHSDKPFTRRVSKRCVIALHCSLGSGRQWTRLAEELGDGYHVIAPDLSGYGSNFARSLFPTTLADEVAQLSDQIDQATGPIHLIGHSYGGAVAFKMAAASPYAYRIRRLTLIEPVLPTLLLENVADRRLHDPFADLGRHIYVEHL